MPEPFQTETARFRAKLKRKAAEGTERPEKIMRVVSQEFSVEVSSIIIYLHHTNTLIKVLVGSNTSLIPLQWNEQRIRLGTRELFLCYTFCFEFRLQVQASSSKLAQRRVIQRCRKTTRLPDDPTNYDEIEPAFTRTFDGQQFLLKNVQLKEGRMMIFSTVTNLRRLSKSGTVILDGTFSSAPNEFRQIFTIHGSIGSEASPKFVPFVHALLPSKSKQVYKAALACIKSIAKDHGIVLNPPVILTDFEHGEIHAVGAVFPRSIKRGCFFHLSKNWWKKMQDLRLRGKHSGKHKHWLFWHPKKFLRALSR